MKVTSVELEVFATVALLALEARLATEFTPIVRHSWIALFNFVIKEMTFDKPVFLPRVHSNDYIDQFSQRYSESESIGYSEKSLSSLPKPSMTITSGGISNSKYTWDIIRDFRDNSLMLAEAPVDESCTRADTEGFVRSDLIVDEI